MSGEAQTVAPVEVADTSALEREIDRMVYTPYGLTEEQIAITKGAAFKGDALLTRPSLGLSRPS